MIPTIAFPLLTLLYFFIGWVITLLIVISRSEFNDTYPDTMLAIGIMALLWPITLCIMILYTIGNSIIKVSRNIKKRIRNKRFNIILEDEAFAEKWRVKE